MSINGTINNVDGTLERLKNHLVDAVSDMKFDALKKQLKITVKDAERFGKEWAEHMALIGGQAIQNQLAYAQGRITSRQLGNATAQLTKSISLMKKSAIIHGEWEAANNLVALVNDVNTFLRAVISIGDILS